MLFLFVAFTNDLISKKTLQIGSKHYLRERTKTYEENPSYLLFFKICHIPVILQLSLLSFPNLQEEGSCSRVCIFS